MMSRSSSRTRQAAAVTAAVAALALAGCGGAGGSDSASSAGSAQAPLSRGASPGADAKTGATEGSGGSSASGGGQAADAATFDERIVRTADMNVQATDVPSAVRQVRTIVQTAKGFVADEQTTTSPEDPRPAAERGNDPAGPRPPWTQSVLTVRVPNASLDRVMQQVGELGSVLNRNQSSEDVTSQYVDTASRVRSQTASVERVRALLARATNLGQVVQIEGELARREADLESLKARLKSLEDKTTLSTLTITLSPRETTVAPTQHDNAFVDGLRAGWTALLSSAGVVLTVVGALLPFAVVLALLAAPVAWWARRQRRRPRTAEAQPAP